MALSTLKDRVRAATQTAVTPTAAPAAMGETFVQAPAAVDEAAASGDPQQNAADAVLTWLRRYEHHVTGALPAHMESGPFLAAVRNVLPSLRSCNPASVLQATLTAARFGLVPDGREAVITAEAGRAVFIATYRGYIALMHRTGEVASVRVGMVYEGDEFTYEPTAPPPLDFTLKQDPSRTEEQRGAPLFAYAFAWFTNGHRSQVVTVNRERAEEIRNEHSRAYAEAEVSGKRDSFWHTHFDPMWLKTAARQLEKFVPTSAEVRALVAADQAGEAGHVQLLHAPDQETAALVAEADRAGDAAETSQEEPPTVLPRKRSLAKRSQPRRTTRRSRRGRRS